MKLVHSGFQFTRPLLTHLEFIPNAAFDKDEFLGIEIMPKVSIKDRQENKATVVMGLSIGEKKTSPGYPFFLEIQMQADFRWQDIALEKVDRLLGINAPSLLLSYMRPHISSITNASIYPVLNVPFIDFSESVNREADIDKS